MLPKSHDSRARIAEKRIVCDAAVLSALIGVLVYAGPAGADVTVPTALNGAATAPSAATVATATTVATAATQPPAVAAVKQPPAPTGQGTVHPAVPAGETATQSAGNVVGPVLKTATQSAGNVVGPVLKTATQSAGNVVAAATNVTQGASSVTQTVVNLANPVTTAPQGLVSSAPTAEDLSRAVTRVAPQVGNMSLARAINVPSSGSGSITRAISPTTPGGAGRGGTFSGASAVPVGGGRPSATSRCGLAGPEDRLIAGCGAAAARQPTFLSVLPFGEASASTASLDGPAAGPASTAARGGSPPDRVRGSAAPSPAPGGITRSTAAASGLALPIFLTLAGLMLLGGSRAMRRLRLFSEPWRSARFVLMPERPG